MFPIGKNADASHPRIGCKVTKKSFQTRAKRRKSCSHCRNKW